MLVVPPPEFLLHSESRSTYDYFNSTNLQSRLEKPATPTRTDQYPSLSTSDVLYLASLALSLGEIDACLEFLTIAITRNSVPAMNTFVGLHNILPMCDPSESGHLQQSGLARLAIRFGSIDAYRHLGQLLIDTPGQTVMALSCSLKHYLETQHSLSACAIAAIVEKLKGEDARKWMKLAVSKGGQVMIRSLVAATNPEDQDTLNMWRKVVSSMDIFRGRPEIYKRLKACVGQNFAGIKFMVFADYVLNKENVFFERTSRALQRVESTGRKKFVTDNDQTQSQTPNVVSSGVRYPMKGRTSAFLQALRLASPDFSERNLNLARGFLFLIFKENPHGILNSELWRLKSQSDDPDDLVRCGFLASLLGDYECALILFRRAAKLGNRTASAMAGYILVHHFRQIKEGLFFLGQCVTDPCAQIHIFLFTRDSIFEKRALALASLPRKTSIYEMCGDLFSDGIKYPYMESAARAFYGVAYEDAVEKGEDITNLLVKLQSLDG